MRAHTVLVCVLLAVLGATSACGPSAAWIRGNTRPSSTPSCYLLTPAATRALLARVQDEGVTPTNVLGIWWVPSGTSLRFADMLPNEHAAPNVCVPGNAS